MVQIYLKLEQSIVEKYLSDELVCELYDARYKIFLQSYKNKLKKNLKILPIDGPGDYTFYLIVIV